MKEYETPKELNDEHAELFKILEGMFILNNRDRDIAKVAYDIGALKEYKFKMTQEQFYFLSDTADILIDYDGMSSTASLKRLIDEARERINETLKDIRGNK